MIRTCLQPKPCGLRKGACELADPRECEDYVAPNKRGKIIRIGVFALLAWALIFVGIAAFTCHAWHPRDWTYTTYADATITVERQNELGLMDTVKIYHVISKAVNGPVTCLHVYHGVLYTITEPREKIIKEE